MELNGFCLVGFGHVVAKLYIRTSLLGGMKHTLCRSEEGMSRMPCERPFLILLLSDGGMLAYQTFLSPLGLRFARISIDWLSHANGRGPRGASKRMIRFDGIGETHKYRSISAICIILFSVTIIVR